MVVKPLVLSERQTRAVDIIQKEFRNIFEHPNFTSLSFANLDVAQNVFYMFDVTEQLALETGALKTRFSGKEESKVAALCVAGKELSKNMALTLEKKLRDYNEADIT